MHYPGDRSDTAAVIQFHQAHALGDSADRANFVHWLPHQHSCISDNDQIVRKISNRAEALDKIFPILLEVNTTAEGQKHGFRPDQISEMLFCIALPGVSVQGLMTLGPLTSNENEIRSSFIQLRELKDALNGKLEEKKIMELSMGMSSDFEIAVEEGATMVRLGTVLLGPRGNP